MKTKAAKELEARTFSKAASLAAELSRKGWVTIECGAVVVTEDRTAEADEWFPKVIFTVSAKTVNNFDSCYVSWTVRFPGRSWKRASVSFYGRKHTLGFKERKLTARDYFLATAGL